MNRKSTKILVMNEEQAAAMESRLNTDTDALISSILTNENVEAFLGQLDSFIAKKNTDISAMCGEHSLTFSKSIEGAQSLGEGATSLQTRVLALQSQIKSTIDDYEKNLSETVTKRQNISVIDQELEAISEALVVLQTLENINEEIKAKNYYIAVVQCLAFADYDSRISGCSMIQGLQKDVDAVLQYIEFQTENAMRKWMTDFRDLCEDLGRSYLYGTPAPTVSYGAVYENYMVKRQLGLLDNLRKDYADRRVRQLGWLIDQWKENMKVNNPSMVDRIRSLLSRVAGWFLAEAKISSDGFCLMSQAMIDEHWKITLENVQKSLDLENMTAGKLLQMGCVDDMILLAKEVALFQEKMELCSLSCDSVNSWMKKKTPTFRKSLVILSKRTMKNEIENNSYGRMMIKTQEEYDEIARFNICENPPGYPYEAKFVPALPIALNYVEQILNKWISFTGKNSDEQVAQLHAELINAVVSNFGALGKESATIPPCGFVIASLIALKSSIPYFEQKMQESSHGGYRSETEKVRKEIQSQIDVVLDRCVQLFKDYIFQIVDVHIVRMMLNDKPPHGYAYELGLFLDAMSEVIQPIIPHQLFQTIIEGVAKCLAARLADVFARADNVSWTPDLISAASQNVKSMGNWPTLIALPSAKQYLNGITNMLSYLLSNQLVTIISDPQFVSKNKGLPFDAMVNILSHYSPKTSKDLYVIPGNLVKTLIQKFTPFCEKKPVADKKSK